ncbi:MAG TPA: TatD family hydrolase [Burkholderiaceae bacterium]
MWIDTHCHLDAGEFGGQGGAVAARAAQSGVTRIVIPAVEVANFPAVAQLAGATPGAHYALGIHPMYVARAEEGDLVLLREAIAQARDDERFVAVGEIGLDFFVPELREGPLRDKQEHFYSEQLKIAREFKLPVLLHVRRSQDIILKYLRRIAVPGGIAHAFNGSFQQAETFIGLGFKLGFGGEMTYTRSRQIRRLAAELPLDAIVLETDAPDIPPAWEQPGHNTPEHLPRIGAVFAELRGMSLGEAADATSANAHAVLPRLA